MKLSFDLAYIDPCYLRKVVNEDNLQRSITFSKQRALFEICKRSKTF